MLIVLGKKEAITASKHRHCLVCGSPVKIDKEFCSEECKKEYERLLRRRKYITAMGLIVPIALII